MEAGDGDLKKSKEAMVVSLDTQAQPSGIGNGKDTRKKKLVVKNVEIYDVYLEYSRRF